MWDIKDIAIGTILSLVVTIFLNYLVHMVFPDVPIVKAGVGIILLLISITLVMLFVFVRDGRFTKEEVYAMVFIIVIMLGVYWVTKKTLPELYSLFPQGLKETLEGAFSFVN